MRPDAHHRTRFWHTLAALTRAGVVVAVWMAVADAAGAAEPERRGRFEPLLLLETGARTAACDVLTFSADGQRLFAAGDDKVVRVWKVTDQGLEPDIVLRWSVWREQRGSIYALALSPDKENRFAAVAGLGVKNGTVVVLDCVTGDVAHALTDVKGNGQVIWRITFSPTGNEVAFGTNDGSVWLWNLKGQKNDVRKLGRHPDPKGQIVLMAYRARDRLLTVARNGSVLEWSTDRPGTDPKSIWTLGAAPVFTAAISPDRRLLVAAGEKRKNHLEIHDLETGRSLAPLTLGGDDLPQSLAFDAKGTRLAVGARTVPAKADFFKETGSRVVIYDLRGSEWKREDGPDTGLRAEALAFHPDGKRFATAGGDNHEVVLWDLSHSIRKPIAESRSPGSCLWGVGLSADGRTLGFREQRLADPPTPNRRAQGPWRAFNLQDRQWAPAGSFRPVEPLETLDGWNVVFDSHDGFVWKVKKSNEEPVKLPLDPDLDDRPWCYTFLPAHKGQPVRLAVGHYWGVSVFELGGQGGPKRIKLMVGHQGTVTALAPSDDGRLLVSASRDQTVAAWATEDWPSSWLGAVFAVRLGRVYVDAVDPGSAAWEAGLVKGDEVVLVQHDRNQLLFDREGVVSSAERKQLGIKVVGAEDCVTFLMKGALDNGTKLKLGRELLFDVRRGNEKLSMLTRGYQRPLWRFFPWRNGEWALWRHLDLYYDCSTNGDAVLGWQQGSLNAEDKPTFYPARHFEKDYRRPDKVSATLLKPSQPDRINLADIEPPALSFVADAEVVKDQPLRLKLKASPRGQRDVHRPETVILWVGDHRYRIWSDRDLPANGEFTADVTLKPEDLRRGRNVLTLQCFNKAGTSETKQLHITKEAPARASTLFVILVGVADYHDTKGPAKGRPFAPLPGTLMDVEKLNLAWKAQARKKTKLYQDIQIISLENEEVTREAVVGELDKIAHLAKPDDLVVFFYSGHGWTENETARKYRPGTLVLVGPHYDAARPDKTGLTTDDLFPALTSIRCRKLVLLNACHSGDATARTLRDPIRELTPGGVGPTLLTAARHEENAFVFDVQGSLFAQAIVEALRGSFRKADENNDGQLDLRELATYVCDRVPKLLEDLQTRQPELFEKEDLKLKQTPQCFPPSGDLERFPIAVRD